MLNRRDFLRAAGAGAVAGAALITESTGLAQASVETFEHGVASGDPRSDAVLIWTRVSGAAAAVKVRWEIGVDADLRKVIASGSVTTSATRDYTVKVDVTRLRPATTYWYRFRAGSTWSPTGRTRTSPATASTVERLGVGLVSCSNFTGGYFAAYRHLADRDDLDLILHVGDYLYEYGNGADLYGPGPAIGRSHEPSVETVTLDQYRRRHAQYKTDPDLQRLHQRYPFVVTWDDHESANDGWRDGAENHGDNDYQSEGTWSLRRAAALKAYFEWMPVRAGGTDGTSLTRSFSFGDLADLAMLDLRRHRDEQVEYPQGVGAIDDPARTLTGRPQMDWLKSQLANSTATWKLVGNPVMISPVLFPPLPQVEAAALGEMIHGPVPQEGLPYNVDQWDGYAAERRELLGHLSERQIDGVVFLTGDIHSTWACDVPLDAGAYNPLDPSGQLGGSPSVAVEFVGTSVTSDNLDDILQAPPRTASLAVEAAFKASNRHVKELEFDSHGFSVVDITRDRVRCDWFYISDRELATATLRAGPSWITRAGTNFIEVAS